MQTSEYSLMKEKDYIDSLGNNELDKFIINEKKKELTLIEKFKIGYALLRKTFIDEAFIYFNMFKQDIASDNNILWYKQTFKNSDGSYTTYDWGNAPGEGSSPPEPDDPNNFWCSLICCICGGCCIADCCNELGCFEWSDCPQICLTCPCCCCSWC